MKPIEVRAARREDRAAFLSLASEVESLFGPMVGVREFEDALDSAIAEGRGFVACENGLVKGAVLIGREDREIGWLVVSEGSRGRGAGRALLETALEALGPGAVRVETFASGIVEGDAARALYLRHGFAPTGARGATPAGVATEVLGVTR